MAIDWEHERVIPLREVRKYVTSRAPGKRVSPSTIWRWAMRSENPLETFATPGGRFTSVEAIGRFIARVTEAKGLNSAETPVGRTNEPYDPNHQQPSANAVRAGEQLRRLIDGTMQDGR